MGHLQRFFAKMTNARQTPGGGGWAPMELIETLGTKNQSISTNFIMTIYRCYKGVREKLTTNIKLLLYSINYFIMQ